MEFAVVLVTTKDQEQAGMIASSLVESKLAGCVNILPSIRSVYTWEDKVCNESESLLIIKARRESVAQVTAMVKQLHSYTVPEVIALPIVDGSTDYLGWLANVTQKDKAVL